MAAKCGKQFAAKTFIRAYKLVPEFIKLLFKVVKLGIIAVTFKVETTYMEPDVLARSLSENIGVGGSKIKLQKQ